MWSSRRVGAVVVALVAFIGIQINAFDNLNGFSDLYGPENTYIVFREPAALFNIISMNPFDVRFFYYPDARKPDSFEEIEAFKLGSLKKFRVGPSKPVKILIHGFNSSSGSVYPQNVKNAYLNVDQDNTYNIIVVDWSMLAEPRSIVFPAYYPAAVENVKDVGVHVGELIVWLRDAAGVDLSKVHLVGHSLGAHVSGQAGATVYEKTGEKVGRITALEPAGPLFLTDLVTKRIDKKDAVFVDVYHTNTSALKLGQYATIGHVDFYLNGGTAQPECSQMWITSGSCSHSMCHKIFTQMILKGPSKKSCVCDAISYLFRPNYCCNVKLALGEYCAEGTAGEFFVTYKYNL